MSDVLHNWDDGTPLSVGGDTDRLRARYGDRMRYCPAFKKWFVWDDTVWCPDGDGAAFRFAERVVREHYSEAQAIAKDALASQAFRYARQADKPDHINNILEQASTRQSLIIRQEDLDSNPWLVTALNGITIDLKTGETRQPSPTDYMTKVLGAKYDEKATCPTWDAFMKMTFDDNQSLIDYVKRCIGYSLTGSTQEQVLFFLYGPTGDNGKTVFVNLLRALLSEDYCKNTDITTFQPQRPEKVRNDLAGLVGARVVIAAEPSEGAKFDMGRIKQMTGEDRISARFLNKEFFEYTPQFKLWIHGNHLPIISERTDAAWNRIQIIPFNVTISKDMQDKDLTCKLKRELPGILNWALEGLADYNKQGLNPPKDVLDLTKGYREDSDSVGSFIQDCCDCTEPDAKIKNTDLFEGYKLYCAEDGFERLSRRKFTSAIEATGFKRESANNAIYWRGLSMRPIVIINRLPNSERLVTLKLDSIA